MFTIFMTALSLGVLALTIGEIALYFKEVGA